MADLLSTGAKAKFAKAMEDLADTFLKETVTYFLAGRQFSTWNESESSVRFDEYSLRAKVIEINSKEENYMKRSVMGRFDEAEAYVLIYFQDLINEGLADLNGHFLNPDRDYMIVNGERTQVIGIYKIPDLGGEQSMIAVYFKKQLNNGA